MPTATRASQLGGLALRALVVFGLVVGQTAVHARVVDASGPRAPLAACTAGYHSAWNAQSAYPTLSPGQTATVWIEFTNTGCNTWDGNLRLGTWNPTPGQDQPSNLGGASGCSVVTDWSACNRIAPSNGSSFAYGQIARFTFTLKAPASGGTYYVYLRPLEEGITWMEDQGVFMQVNDLACTSRSPHDNVARQVHTEATISNITIVSSSILEYDPSYTAFNSTGTNASVLLAIQTPSLQWAQLGWLKSTLDGGVIRREVFMEFFIDSTHNYFQYWPAMPVGNSTWYQIQYDGTNYNMYVGGSLYRTIGGLSAPQQYQMMEETHDYVDQMPGGVNNHVTFINSQYQAGNGAVFMTSPITADTSGPYNGTNPSQARYEMWDGSCAN